ncbi:hypothetical protein QZH41_004793 [Actinostola sp. cb2023]|nr:hypothetical protein QZH41_004793 [Actinostola sp. cb2023]
MEGTNERKNLSSNQITRLDKNAFAGLMSLEKLYLQNNDIAESNVDQDAFDPLRNLRFLKVDSFVMCCYAKQSNPDLQCESPHNELSSCEDLLKIPTLRVFIWILGLLALLGNAWVMIFWNHVAHIDRGERGKKSRVQSFLLSNLAVSDLMMGVYLIIIASHDVKWKGDYFRYDVTWRSSRACEFAGALSMTASEASILILTTITADRLNSIVFHIRARPFTMVTARIVCFLIWLCTLTMSIVPIILKSYFYDEKRRISFYGRSSVCLPLQLSSVRTAGWEYAVAIYIAFNGFAFLFILLSYVAIFVKVRASSKAVRSNMNNDAALARRVVLIILTDFFCWIPVVIIGCLSLTQGFEDSQGQAYAWIAVFVLPINSSLNPILYTFSNPQFRRLFACKKCCSHHDVRANVRLNGSHHPNQGRVEIFQKGKWGKICDEGWDIKDASVVCRELGLPDVTRSFGGQIFETGRSPIYKLFHSCVILPYKQSSFSSLVDDLPTKVESRSLSGACIPQGAENGRFFCDRDWGIQDARVVCRTLGYEDAMFAVKPHMFNDNGGMYYLIKDIRCHGNESSIAECEYTGLKLEYDSCEEVGVICGVRNATVSHRLVGSSAPGSGRVELNLGGHWGTICHNKWSLSNARVVCRNLGYPQAFYATGGSVFGYGSERIVLDNVQCLGNETSLLQCKHGGLGYKSCTAQQEAGVICEKPENRVNIIDITSNISVLNSNQSALAIDNDESTCLYVSANDNTFLTATIDSSVFIHSVSMIIDRNSSFSSIRVIIHPLDKHLNNVVCTPTSEFVAKIGMTYDCSPPTRARHVTINATKTATKFGLCNIDIFGSGE